jgi:hypothetical protein
MVVQTNVLRSALVQRKQSYDEQLTPGLTASVVWTFTQQVHLYIRTPYDENGRLPTPNLYLLLANIRSEPIQQLLSLPSSLVANARIQLPVPRSYEGTDKGTFGQGPPTKTHRSYRGVPSAVKQLLQPRTGNQTITLTQIVQGRGVDSRDYVVKPDFCADMTAFGYCKSPRCTYHHATSVAIDPKDVEPRKRKTPS